MPMKSGVDSFTWGVGGRFQDGIGGRSAGEVADAARGNASRTGGAGAVKMDLCRGVGLTVGVAGSWAGPNGRGRV